MGNGSKLYVATILCIKKFLHLTFSTVLQKHPCGQSGLRTWGTRSRVFLKQPDQIHLECLLNSWAAGEPGCNISLWTMLIIWVKSIRSGEWIRNSQGLDSISGLSVLGRLSSGLWTLCLVPVGATMEEDPLQTGEPWRSYPGYSSPKRKQTLITPASGQYL